MKKAIKITAISLSAFILMFYAMNVLNTGITDEYTKNFGKHMFDSTYMNEPGNNTEHIIALVDYDILSDKYKNIISREDYISAVTDEQIFCIYKRIAEINPDQVSEAGMFSLVCSTYGYDMCGGTDGCIINGKSYRLYHDFDFKTPLFSGETYISKWMIDIKDVSGTI